MGDPDSCQSDGPPRRGARGRERGAPEKGEISLGRAGLVRLGPGRPGGVLLVVPGLRHGGDRNRRDMKQQTVAPFIVAFVAFALAFVAIDYALMSLQGLSLIFHP